LEYTKILSKGIQSSLPPIEDGKLRFTIDTGKLFLDHKDKRIEITDFIKTLTEDQILSIIAPSPKVYISKDTNKMFMFNEESSQWECIGEKNSSSVSYAETTDWNGIKNKPEYYPSSYSNNSSTADYSKAVDWENVSNKPDNFISTYAKNSGTAEYSKAVDWENVSNKPEYYASSFASSATNADTATYANNAESASKATSATSATYSSTAEYAKATSWNNISDKPTYYQSSYADSSDSALYASNDGNGNNIVATYAPLESPLFTGSPSVPTASDSSNDTQIANTAFVKNAINSALENFSKIEIKIFSDYSDLPETGESLVLYFVKNNSGEENNLYDEYMWISDKYEIIGSTSIDLSDYYKKINITGTGNAITAVEPFGDTLTFSKNATFLTKHPSITTNSSTYEESPDYGDTFNVVDNIILDDNGHLVNFRKKLVKFPTQQGTIENAVYATNAGTADYASNANNATNASSATYSTSAGSASKATSATSATYSSTANYSKNANKAENASTADYATNANTASTATYASTAEYVINSNNAGTATYANSVPWSGITDKPTYYSASFATSATNADTATYAISAGSASKSINAGSATYSTNAGTASYSSSAGSATNSDTASYSKNSDFASKATSATSATYATTATNSGTATYSKSSLVSIKSLGVDDNGDFDFGDIDDE
jgi:hypothetical protein